MIVFPFLDRGLLSLQLPNNYLKNYKNPCWISTLSDPNPYKHNSYNILNAREKYPDGGNFSARSQFSAMQKILTNRTALGDYWRLRCLPYVYLVGVTKSGTTDLFDKMVRHPEIEPGALKEPMWWNRHTVQGITGILYKV